MRFWKGLVPVCLAAAAVSCTPGATSAPTTAVLSGAVVIHVSLGKYVVQSQYGQIGGYSQNPLTIARGTVVQFINDDSFGHTASSVGTAGFPKSGPGAGSLTQSGTDFAQTNWSTGELQGGSASQAFTAATPGTYYYGCFFHYSSQTPMRGVIVVQ
jgi:plastocyanin